MKPTTKKTKRRRTGKIDVPTSTRQSILKLNSILDGILIDEAVSQFEIIELTNWIHHNKQVIKCATFSEYADVILAAEESGMMEIDFVKSLSALCKKFFKENDILHKDESLVELRFFCHGLLADGYIRNAEMVGLKHWLEHNAHLNTVYPYNELMNVVRIAILDTKEKELLRMKLTDLLFRICKLHSPRVDHHVRTMIIESRKIQNKKR